VRAKRLVLGSRTNLASNGSSRLDVATWATWCVLVRPMRKAALPGYLGGYQSVSRSIRKD
jgi:hypothetical protein